MTPPPVIFSTRFWALVRLILSERRAHANHLEKALPPDSDSVPQRGRFPLDEPFVAPCDGVAVVAYDTESQCGTVVAFHPEGAKP